MEQAPTLQRFNSDQVINVTARWLVVSDRGRQCARFSATTPVFPPQWLRGIERHPPHTHVTCALRRMWDAPGPCMSLPYASCMLHRKLGFCGLWGCGDGPLVVAMAVPAGRCAVCPGGAPPKPSEIPNCPVSAVCKTQAKQRSCIVHYCKKIVKIKQVYIGQCCQQGC
jgi:hypothetical protein